MMLLPIFVFQSLTSYWFCLSIVGLTMVFAGYLWMASIRDLENATGICTACFTARGGGTSGRRATALLGLGWVLGIVGALVEIFHGNLAQFFTLDTSWITLLKVVTTAIFRTFVTEAFTFSVTTRASGFYFSTFEGVVYSSVSGQDETSHLANLTAVEKNYGAQVAETGPSSHAQVELQASLPVAHGAPLFNTETGEPIPGARPTGPRFNAQTGAPINKFDSATGKQQWWDESELAQTAAPQPGNGFWGGGTVAV